MTQQAKKRIFVVLSLSLLIAAAYCALGVLQAASLFTGDRAVRNVQFWGALTCSGIFGFVLFGVLAVRAARRARVAV
ncbi:hypothetical protein [Dyella sp. ASV21]|uniref:hypothetical protein n=1 Tax=Dyella sp. ASV21 TaxID=2795114 RepID=UPI0018EBE7F8|nr:hypothetical protein [Dyella sp. ASV21]